MQQLQPSSAVEGDCQEAQPAEHGTGTWNDSRTRDVDAKGINDREQHKDEEAKKLKQEAEEEAEAAAKEEAEAEKEAEATAKEEAEAKAREAEREGAEDAERAAKEEAERKAKEETQPEQDKEEQHRDAKLKQYLVDNSLLNAAAPGVAYRLSNSLQDKDFNYPVAPWGAVITGIDQGNGWVQVGRRYLPMDINGAPVLFCQDVSLPPGAEENSSSLDNGSG